MSASDKRRVHGVTGTHVLRTASSARHAYHSSSSSAGAGSPISAHAGSGPGSSHLPAVPQRVAVVNASALSDDTDDTNKDKDKEKDMSPGTTTTTSGASTPVTRTASSRTAKEKQRERDRERESASLAAQVRQKDERIAYLEREMDTMEREFQHQLDKLSANESETATFWQAKHSALNQQYLRTDTELRLLRAEVDVREAERAELRQGWEVLRRELMERDEEMRGLRGQVRGLKEFVSTSTRADGQTSDEVFGDGMARLGNGLQNWVISHFRKARLDLPSLDEETTAEISELVPMYEELAKTAKVHLLQSIVSRIFVDMIFDSYFVGLSDSQTRLFRQMEEVLASLCGPTQHEPVNQWRAATLTLLRREAAPQAHLQDDTAVFAEHVVSRTNHVLDRLTGSEGSSARDAALRVLVNNAVELARLLVVQKAVLRVYMPKVQPHQRVLFDPSTMEDVGGLEDDDEDGLGPTREVACVVFPGVVKHGDEHGTQLQYRNMICKAKVVCRQE
ncbi:hypothetical protein CCM_05017 [Cordyceps militaris CM01]|uniref:Involucrin repeat protein n=1 Tax=Cordyceps militaris (strain CM01) TaxID=983644 RepID=G3JG24_CORMM|nr:uncharacterized protein CCM_05017 [Cordyceps militaris CM01]EGX93642.1 hypothetical protein CCM_05017 [Cordyceps militaris CM01]